LGCGSFPFLGWLGKEEDKIINSVMPTGRPKGIDLYTTLEGSSKLIFIYNLARRRLGIGVFVLYTNV